MSLSAFVRVAAAALALSFSVPGACAIVIDISQVGSDVALTASGTFDESLATSWNATVGGVYQSIIPRSGFAAFGTQGFVNIFDLSGPTAFGIGYRTVVTGNTGTVIGFNALGKAFFISSSYVSNSPFSSGAIINNRSLASVGLRPGIYSYWVGGNALTLEIDPVVGPPVPEPATWAMMLLGFAGVGVAVRRRKVRAALLTV